MGDLISELDHYFPEVDGRMPPLRVTAGADPIAKVTLHKHEVVPNCGSFEVRFHDGRDSVQEAGEGGAR